MITALGTHQDDVDDVRAELIGGRSGTSPAL